MRTVKLLLEYDGTAFVGWQFQTNGRSVQGVVEQALSNLLQEVVKVTGAGRTDAGVHALGQVCHFQTASTMDGGTMRRGANAMLPQDVVVRDAAEVPGGFHARYSAKGRRYRYYVSQRPVALLRHMRWFVGHSLDVGVMQQCAQLIDGEHDFQAFCKADADVRDFRCTVHRSGWSKSGEEVIFEVVANRFLHGMVRALVGTMVEVGRGHRPATDFQRILESRDRSQAGMAAPPEGLVLEEVLY